MVFYGVGKGRNVGVYNSWRECEEQIKNVAYAKYRKFPTRKEAEEFVEQYTGSKTATAGSEAKLPSTSAMDAGSSGTSGTVEDTRNVDVRALNLRLDSFEKRFDDCLKQMGGLASEMEHIKVQMKKIYEVLPNGTALETLMASSGSAPGPAPLAIPSTSRSYSHLSSSLQSVMSSASLPSAPLHRSTDSSQGSEKPPSAKMKRKREDSVDSGGTDISKTGTKPVKVKTEQTDFLPFIVDESGFVNVFTDGACIGNGKKEAFAGIGVWFGDGHPLNVSAPVDGRATNNTAEIQAARVAVELATTAGLSKLTVNTDSEFLINCITKWIQKWKTTNYTLSTGEPVKNRVELEKLDAALVGINVKWNKVAAHTGLHGNEMADRLAVEGAKESQRNSRS